MSIGDPVAVRDERDQAAQAALEATVALSLRLLRGAMVVLAALFLCSGFFAVEPHEVALVRRLGRIEGAPDRRVLPPGPHWAWPVVDEVIRVPALRPVRLVTDAFQLEPRATDVTGKAPERKGGLDPERDGYLLTGDANILHATVAVHYQIDDAYAYASRTVDAEALVAPLLDRAVAKAAATRTVDELLTTGKEAFVEAVRAELQRSLDALGVGLRAGAVELASAPPRALNADFAPPPQVRENFVAVAKALQKHDEIVSNARGEAAEIVGRARSEAARIRDEARSAAKRSKAGLQADVALFQALLPEWRRDRAAVETRLVAEALAAVHPEETFVAPPGELRVKLERDHGTEQRELLQRASK
jgi:membrane protease subunit HflK